ncbi:hypothetical protein SAMN06265373_1064 [Shimia sagamensis]|uniref:Zinc-ribbon domain-containing protein n=1 Tax=Shimia sagamensis TaxID=1566352 RepID=A0ABY1P9L1_9RHOB|nr:hypothetical protein SAMN06265373_1064 [Shimia sagamensis]
MNLLSTTALHLCSYGDTHCHNCGRAVSKWIEKCPKCGYEL